MATQEVARTSEVLRRRDVYLSPLDKVQKFFQALTELRQAAEGSPDDKARFAVSRRGVGSGCYILIIKPSRRSLATDGVCVYASIAPYRMLSACESVSLCGEQVVLCLEQQIWQHNRAAETAQEVTGEPSFRTHTSTPPPRPEQEHVL